MNTATPTEHRTPLTDDPSAAPARAPWQEREREGLRAKMADPAHSYEKDGVLRWKSNHATVPPHVYRDAGLVCPATQQRVYDAEMTKFLRDYREADRKAPRNPEAEAEMRAEMRAEFGAGRTVVNIITGRRYRT